MSPCNGIPSIGQNAFGEIVTHTNIVDAATLKLSDIDLEFIATKAASKKKSARLNPERWLVRYQLMEILVRIAIFKLFKSKSVYTEFDAVNQLFHRNILPFI